MPHRAWNSMASFILMFINTHQSCVTVLVEQFTILTPGALGPALGLGDRVVGRWMASVCLGPDTRLGEVS